MGKKVYIFKTFITLCLISLLSTPSFAASLKEQVEKQPRQALPQIEKILAKDVSNEEALFFRAKAYENLGQLDAAKRFYEQFIERYPKRPEVYLNLANIYAKKGNTTKARELLEQGLLSRPEYAKIYQSLKKLNSHLAQSAYQRALSNDKKVAVPALASVSSLVERDVRIREVEVIKEVPIDVIAAVPVETKSLPPLQQQQQQQKQPQENKSSTATTKLDRKESDPVNNVTPKDVASSAEIIPIVKKWALAWSDQSVGRFVSFYSPNYSAQGKNRQQWLLDRKLKLTNKQFITVTVSDFTQEIQSNNEVNVIFKQNYQSDVVSSVATKRLSFKNIDGNWKIVAERIIRQ